MDGNIRIMAIPWLSYRGVFEILASGRRITPVRGSNRKSMNLNANTMPDILLSRRSIDRTRGTSPQ